MAPGRLGPQGSATPLKPLGGQGGGECGGGPIGSGLLRDRGCAVALQRAHHAHADHARGHCRTDSKRVMRFLATLLLLSLAASAVAQSYPSRPIRLIVPFAPGGSADLVGRLLAQQLSESVGQPVVVENKGGASGMLGNDYVAKSPPDGYTLSVGTLGPFAVNPTLYEHVPYDNIRDFAPITLTAIP